MQKWKINIILRSGKDIDAFYKTSKTHPFNVSEEIFNNSLEQIIAFASENDNIDIFIKKNEIAGIKIWKK